MGKRMWRYHEECGNETASFERESVGFGTFHHVIVVRQKAKSMTASISMVHVNKQSDTRE
jgi:hypothetical protein